MKKVLKNMLLTITPLTISANFLVSCNHTSKDNLRLLLLMNMEHYSRYYEQFLLKEKPQDGINYSVGDVLFQ